MAIEMAANNHNGESMKAAAATAANIGRWRRRNGVNQARNQ